MEGVEIGRGVRDSGVEIESPGVLKTGFGDEPVALGDAIGLETQAVGEIVGVSPGGFNRQGEGVVPGTGRGEAAPKLIALASGFGQIGFGGNIAAEPQLFEGGVGLSCLVVERLQFVGKGFRIGFRLIKFNTERLNVLDARELKRSQVVERSRPRRERLQFFEGVFLVAREFTLAFVALFLGFTEFFRLVDDLFQRSGVCAEPSAASFSRMLACLESKMFSASSD